MGRKLTVRAAVLVMPVLAAVATGTGLPASWANPQQQTFDTAQSEFSPGSENMGWWAASHGNISFNDNYYVGSQFAPDDVRDFFTFDLSALAGTVVRAELVIARYDIVSDDASETLEFHDVTTDALTLNSNNEPNAAVFDDLGTGTLYGSYEVPVAIHSRVLRFELSDSAVAAINAAAGGFFSVGGSLVTSDLGEALFVNSDGPRPQWLVVQLAE